tara:strand:- start:359 stop:901 length:543 start_codon:yes stop_codon:yes gene_type:complete
MSDPIIKNPFCVRVQSCDNKFFNIPDHRSKIGNTNFIEDVKLESGNIFIDNKLDPKCSFLIGKVEEKKINEYSTIDNYDYHIGPEVLNKARINNGKDAIHKEGLPISFINIKTIQEGILWYKKHYPKIPDELLPIIARYHWGASINKHTIKKERKFLKNKRRKEMNKIEFKKGQFSLTFE